MTEQEIVDFLKNNREKGIPYDFCPDEVQSWIDIHWEVLLEYSSRYKCWNSHIDNDATVSSNGIYCLPDDYNLVAEIKDGWVEIAIDNSGMIDYREGTRRLRFYYLNYIDIIQLGRCGFIHFGGFQYEEDGIWYMNQQLFIDGIMKKTEKYCDSCGSRPILPIKPLFPIKIRFWREDNK